MRVAGLFGAMIVAVVLSGCSPSAASSQSAAPPTSGASVTATEQLPTTGTPEPEVDTDTATTSGRSFSLIFEDEKGYQARVVGHIDPAEVVSEVDSECGGIGGQAFRTSRVTLEVEPIEVNGFTSKGKNVAAVMQRTQEYGSPMMPYLCLGGEVPRLAVWFEAGKSYELWSATPGEVGPKYPEGEFGATVFTIVALERTSRILDPEACSSAGGSPGSYTGGMTEVPGDIRSCSFVLQ